jgi:hypothetical protein
LIGLHGFLGFLASIGLLGFPDLLGFLGLLGFPRFLAFLGCIGAFGYKEATAAKEANQVNRATKRRMCSSPTGSTYTYDVIS